MKHLGKTLTLCAGLAALPAGGQETGGKTARFEVLQRLEAVRNPDLDPGEDETETLSTTTLAYTVQSKTLRDDLSLRLQTALRLPLSGGSDDPELDNSAAVLRYVHTAPGTRLSASAAIRRRELARLQALELVEDDAVIDDLDDLSSSGTRTSGTLQLGAQFGEDRPFGWGWTAGAGAVRYSGLSATSSLRDVDSFNTALTGRFALTPVLQMTSRLRYSQSKEDGSARTTTYGADAGLTFTRPASELRSAVSLAWPDQSADRLGLTVGGSWQLQREGIVSLDLGGSFADGGDTALIGRFSYQQQLSRSSLLRAELDRQVSDGSDGSVLLRTTGQIGYGIAVTSLTDLNFDLRYLERDTLNSSDDLTEYGLSASLNRQLTKDWSMGVGLSHTARDENDRAEASSEALFFTLKRAWGGSF